eukprot:2511882-Pyramimonas_sp.AAC.1
MVWSAATRPEHALVKMAELVYLWESCQASSCKTWQESRGPVSRACLSLARAGWKYRGPLK